MSQPQFAADRLQTLAEMDDLVRRAQTAGDIESVLIAKMVAAEANRLRDELEHAM